MNKNRINRINDEILRETSLIIRGEIKDPRLPEVVSVTKVDTTNDLSYSTIYISVLGDDEEKQNALDALQSANGFIRTQIAKRINLRVTPELKFVIDETQEKAARMDELFKEVTKAPKEELDEE